jgi:hypothetical protein
MNNHLTNGQKAVSLLAMIGRYAVVAVVGGAVTLFASSGEFRATVGQTEKRSEENTTAIQQLDKDQRIIEKFVAQQLIINNNVVTSLDRLEKLVERQMDLQMQRYLEQSKPRKGSN